MKKLLFFGFFLTSVLCFGQVPQGVSYQAIALDASGNPIVNLPVGIRLSILDSSATGTVVYTETHNPTTNAQGLFNLVIGQGTPTTGTFSAVKWETNSKFLKVEMDAAGGTNYVLVGTTQLLSVPYALYAGKVDSENGIGGTDDENAHDLSFMTATDAYVYSASTAEPLSPYSWQSIPISGVPFKISNNTFLTSSHVYKHTRTGFNFLWVSSPISGQPLYIKSNDIFDALIITSSNAYIYDSTSTSFISVSIDGTFFDSAYNAVLTSTHAYVYERTSLSSNSSWQSIPISGTPLKIKYGNYDGTTFILTTTNAYVYGPDTSLAGPSTDVSYSWKTIPISSVPVLD